MTHGWTMAKRCHDRPFEAMVEGICATLQRIGEAPLALAPLLPEFETKLEQFRSANDPEWARKVRAAAYAEGAG